MRSTSRRSSICSSRQWLARSTTASGSMKSGGAAGRDVVDDAAHLAAEVGLDRHDVAAVAQGDERLLGGEPAGR